MGRLCEPLYVSHVDSLSGAGAVVSVIGAALIIMLHKDNIERLRAGTEPKIGSGGERRV
jgi:glycerol-3-phosphate acyltransferase PlsY